MVQWASDFDISSTRVHNIIDPHHNLLYPECLLRGRLGNTKWLLEKVRTRVRCPQGRYTYEPESSIHRRHRQIVKNIEILGLATKQDGRRHYFSPPPQTASDNLEQCHPFRSWGDRQVSCGLNSLDFVIAPHFCSFTHNRVTAPRLRIKVGS